MKSDFVGYIKLYRSVMQNWVYTSGRPFCKFGAWVDLLMFVFHGDYEAPFNGEMLMTKRGSRRTSVLELSSRWGWGRKKTARFLDDLEMAGMLSQKRTSSGTTVTIVNYSKFQNPGTTDGTTKEQPRNNGGTTEEHRKRKYKECKEGKKKCVLHTPAPEEVHAYCQEKGYVTDEKKFLLYNQGRGWPVPDWKAAMDLWVENDEKHKAGKQGGIINRAYDMNAIENDLGAN